MTSDTTTRPVRVRFAPSPTGELHIGGARTALYNWAFARATGGTFVLRIEDTDPERSTEANKQVILRALRWLGLTWDEGPEVEGEFGPYLQTQRFDTYAEALERLKERDAVYPCFCTKEELDAKRAAAEQTEGGYSGYDRTCRHLDSAEAQRRIDAGEPHVWRLKVPENHGPIEFDDAVYGHMSFPANVMDDMILVRTDGTPTYNFAVVCDDANMHISHVIRGDDHLSNTPRQILIYEALGYPIPTFAHLSMILGTDGRKLSKRRNATSVEQYEALGYLPDALINFLALLGWSLDGETTLIDRATLAQAFSLDRITKKDAIFDETKLDWMNAQYIKAMDADAWVQASTPWLAQARAAGLRVAHGAPLTVLPSDSNKAEAPAFSDAELEEATNDIATRPEWYAHLYPLIAERENRLTEAADKLQYLFWGSHIELDEKSVTKVLKKEGARAEEVLRAVRDILADETIPWQCDPLQDTCRTLTETLDLKAKLIFQPIRVAVCGNMVSPPLFESIELMDRADVVARVDAVLAEVFGA